MCAMKISEAANLELGFDRAGDNAFEACACYLVQCNQHGVGGFADCNDEHAAVGVEVVEVFANSENAALAMQVPREGLGDAGFAESVVEDVAGDVLHYLCLRYRGTFRLGRARLPAVPQLGAFDFGFSRWG